MSGVQTIPVGENESGMRLDRWFRTRYPDLRHGELEKLLRKGQIRVDGGRVKANRRLGAGEMIRIPPLERQAADVPDDVVSDRDAAFVRSLVVYEDAAMIAVNKPFGLAVQGGERTPRHLDAMLPALAKGGERPRLVHRLDRDTGGLLLLARTRKAATRLGEAFQRRAVDKTYWALVAGAPRPRRGTINLAIAAHVTERGQRTHERMRPSVAAGAKSAVTDYQVLESAGGAVSFIALRPRTGRKHQLRVHCAAIGAPIVGDRKYGGRSAAVDGVPDALHLFCRSMTFPHPDTGKAKTLTADLTGHMRDTWALFGFDAAANVDWSEVGE